MGTYHDAMHVDPRFEAVLADAGLDTVSDVLRCSGDRLAAWSRTTDTINVGCSTDENGRWRGELFVKRYYYPGWKRRIKAMLRGTFLGRSRARAEYESLTLLRSRGVPTVRPVAYGERRTWHFLQGCFLITEGVAGATSLIDFVLHQAPHLSPRQRRSTLVSLAERVRRMHETGLVHGQLFWRNILIRPTESNDYEFFFLDAGVAGRSGLGGVRSAAAVRDISQLATIAERFCSQTELWRFARAYLGAGWSRAELRRWANQVVGRARRYAWHEAYRLKVERLFKRHVTDGSGPDLH